MWQSNYIAGRLREEYPGCEVTLKKIVTKGDRILDVPLAKIGGKGLFTKEIEQELLDGTIDLAVHSLKDMPTVLPEGLCLTAITERTSAGDAFVSNKYNSIEEMPEGSVLGTSSLRRRAQLLARRPDLKIVDLRGNVDTRLKKLDEGQMDAIILAAAGLTVEGGFYGVYGTASQKERTETTEKASNLLPTGLDLAGNRWWPTLSNVVILTARKKVSGMTLVGRAAFSKSAVAASVNPAVQQNASRKDVL